MLTLTVTELFEGDPVGDIETLADRGGPGIRAEALTIYGRIRAQVPAILEHVRGMVSALEAEAGDRATTARQLVALGEKLGEMPGEIEAAEVAGVVMFYEVARKLCTA